MKKLFLTIVAALAVSLSVQAQSENPYKKFTAKLPFAMPEVAAPVIPEREVEPSDMENFQTIYAKHEGAVTAPASGLHFSRELLKRLEIRDRKSVV